MSDGLSQTVFENDKRPECKYGHDCYQKNAIHHEKYKHPPRKRKTEDLATKKKIKINDYFKVQNKVDTVASSSSSNSKMTDLIDDRKLLSPDCNAKMVRNNDGENMSQNANNTALTSCGDNKPIQKEKTLLADQGAVVSNVKVDVYQDDNELTDTEKRSLIKDMFLVNMPQDFYSFWNLCKVLNKENPCGALESVGLKLVGPYDVLGNKFNKNQSLSHECLLHWRYYRDPPEMQTVLKGDDATGYHIGYFRDIPDEYPSLMVSNCALKDGVLNCVGDNIFAAVNTYLEELKLSGNPFKKMKINKYQTEIKKKADELGLNLLKKSNSILERDKRVVVKTFNKVGLVVPYNKKTQLGYRNLTMGNKELRILLDKIAKSTGNEKQKYLSNLQPVLTYATIATDECDFGTGLELGWNLMSHGVDCLNSTICRFLATSYKLLNRHAFVKIIEVHMQNRKKGCSLSVV